MAPFTQTDLFGARPAPPEGFRYRASLISADDETALIQRIRELALRPFQFHGFEGKRRVTSFGWRYDFARQALDPTEEIPAFLLPLRLAAGTFAGIAPEALQQALVTEYEAGAAIGWHRDRGVFGQVVGVSLAADCLFRFRRKVGTRWERASLTAERRSAYLL
ncbi:MAG TPA: alpha-ketoglutarate-dependent dioxygenase AlkB, partial [Gemmatimonadaceae bacterium]|nr:alpha-ketoglutarate-dependent dioxygenase AlkB [Gemmatimonadaceae bacterium]